MRSQRKSLKTRTGRRKSKRSTRRSRRSTKRSTRRRSRSRLFGGSTSNPKTRPSFEVGQSVKWQYADNVAYGVVVKIHYDDVELMVHDRLIKMRGRPTRPVYEIQQESGLHLLKSANQLKKTTKKLDIV